MIRKVRQNLKSHKLKELKYLERLLSIMKEWFIAWFYEFPVSSLSKRKESFLLEALVFVKQFLQNCKFEIRETMW